MRIALAGVVGLLLLALAPASVEAKSPPMTISGSDLPHTITVPFPDQGAFWDIEASPALLSVAPAELGAGYDVLDWYWDYAIRGNGPGPEVEDVGVYYPAAGVVRATRGVDSIWLKLDTQRDAMLRRYVTLAREGLIPPEPSVVQVISAAALHNGDEIGVRVAGRRLRSAETAVFYSEGVSMPASQEDAVARGWRISDSNVDVSLLLPEGREVNLIYLRSDGYLVFSLGNPGNGTLPVAASKVSPALRALLEGGGAANGTQLALAGEGWRERSTSFPMWALLTVATIGTISLACLAVGSARFRGRGIAPK